ncbi:MAG: inositol monophosphatase family protein [Elainella sp.]
MAQLSQPSPREILAALLPQLRIAAAYAQQIQTRIVAQPSKETDNFLAAALSDADLSIQTFIEVTLLGLFPHLRFYGEEYEKTYNTKYFRGIDLGEQDDYLITLDPIDGTRFYLDGHSNYQIILAILNRDDYEAAIAVSPAQQCYSYALRNGGCWQGALTDDLAACQPVTVTDTSATVFLGWDLQALKPILEPHYRAVDITRDYSSAVQIPAINGILTGEIAGAVLKAGQWIDSAALAFMAREAGAVVTTLSGEPLPPLHSCRDYRRSGVLIAASPEVHQDLLAALALPQA